MAEDAVAERLRRAELEVVGRFATASNATLLVRLRADDGSWPVLPLDPDGDLVLGELDPDGFAVYKPRRGEAPLWDFPSGTLYLREVAAHAVDRLLGWDLVPTTVVREEAPHGVGAFQRFVPHDPGEHYFALLERGDEGLLEQLRRMVLFDAVIDNADRKGGHVLLEGDRVRLVDHGVSFSEQAKLRTVGWHFAGEPVPDGARAEVAALADMLVRGDAAVAVLEPLLSDGERRRLLERARAVAGWDRYPEPVGERPYPWPLL
ncbi:MAG: SCO1664 family protein [Actinobacteria bacterium]|nr:SCO1664 family protein [Actinomycetota bacterium]